MVSGVLPWRRIRAGKLIQWAGAERAPQHRGPLRPGEPPAQWTLPGRAGTGADGLGDGRLVTGAARVVDGSWVGGEGSWVGGGWELGGGGGGCIRGW